ncbi:MAG: glycosyltransferase family 39 protein [Oscillospiraceae bacterium]|jgi:hypothetical protein|nr:glycosyltransferase family 39 protein [Oscillospiraceae bacterium]
METSDLRHSLLDDSRNAVSHPLLKFAGKIFPVAFLLIIAGIYLYKPLYMMFGSPEYTSPHIPTEKASWLLSQLVVTMISVGLLMLAVWLVTHRKAATLSARAEKITAISVLSFFFILVFLGELSLYTDIPSYDNQMVREGALSIMNYESISDEVKEYIWFWPNNRGITVVLGFLGRIAGFVGVPYRLLWIAVDSSFITLSVLFAYMTVKLFCSRSVSTVILVLISSFLLFSACSTPLANSGQDWYMLYTDSFSMPFSTIAVYCFARFFLNSDRGYKRLLLTLGGCAAVGISSFFKPTPFIILIAYVAVLLLHTEKRKLKEHALFVLKNAAVLVLALLITVLPFEQAYSQFEMEDSPGKQKGTYMMAHMLILGMLNRGQDINHNGVMVFDDPISINPFQDRGRWNYAESGFFTEDVLIARLRQQHIGMLSFYYLKDVQNLSLTYEPNVQNKLIAEQPESYYKTPFLSSWKNALAKAQLPTRAVLWNVTFFLIGIGAYLVMKRKIKLSSAEVFLNVGMTGVLAYMTIFESGDRYAMQFWPLFLIMAGVGLMRIFGVLESCKSDTAL